MSCSIVCYNQTETVCGEGSVACSANASPVLTSLMGLMITGATIQASHMRDLYTDVSFTIPAGMTTGDLVPAGHPANLQTYILVNGVTNFAGTGFENGLKIYSSNLQALITAFQYENTTCSCVENCWEEDIGTVCQCNY